MLVQGLLLDFYGTLVHEDDDVVDSICHTISAASAEAAHPRAIGSFWWRAFSSSFRASFGPGFRSQRAIETDALAATCEHFGADLDAVALSELMFAQWQAPKVFADAEPFLAALTMPLVVVSNIDRVDIEAAIATNRLRIDTVITSDDVRSYKPRPELFRAGLDALGLDPGEVLHVGDSETSDVVGANEFGVRVAWVNRKHKPAPAVGRPDLEVSSLTELLAIL